MVIRDPSQLARPKVPRIASDWKLLFRPEKTGCYINDHCVFKGPDGQWHLIGITSTEAKANAESERWFSHARTPALWSEPMTELGRVCDDGNRAWAPCVTPHEGRYHMLYGPSPTKAAISRELSHWMGETVTLLGAPPEVAHRDHMVVKLEESTWLLYTTGIDDVGHGIISVFVTNDLRTYRFVRIALRTTGRAALNPPWGATESPFVVKLGDWYYLSMTYTNCALENYHQTLVFPSLNPFDFGTFDADRPEESVIAHLHAHAPEYVYCEEEKSWFITTCGWRNCGTPFEGAAAIAKLAWDEAT